MRRVPLLVVAILALVGSLLAPALAPVPAAAQDDEATWTSPTYGFSVSWDPSLWEEQADDELVAAGPDELDRLLLFNGAASLYVEGVRRYDGVAGDCVRGELDVLSQDPSISNVLDRPDLAADGPDASAGGIELTLTTSDGSPVRLVDYVFCMRNGPDSVVIVTIVTERSLIAEQLAAAQPVIDSIVLAGAASGLDDGGVPIDADTFAEWVALGSASAPIAGPVAGALVPEPSAQSAALVAAGVSEADFVARLRWQNPTETDAWDVGIAFRDQPDGTHYRLILDPTGAWSFGIGTDEKLAEGDAPAMNLAPGAANGLEIVVSGGQAGFSINGEFVASLDVSAITDPGDVWFGSGFSVATAADGATVNYRDFAVWSLAGLAPEAPESPIESTPEAPVEPTPEPGIAPDLPDLPDFPLPSDLEPPADAPATDDGAPRIVAVTVDPVAGAGVSGLATLTDVEGEASVNLVLRGTEGGEIAVIHEGSCADLSPDPAFLLEDPDASGRSKSALGVPRSEIVGGGYAIAVHASADAFGDIVACGDIG